MQNDLSEVCGHELRVSVLPSFLELPFDECRVLGLVLRYQAFMQAEERTPVARVALQVGSESLFRFREFTGGQVQTTEGLANGEEPLGWLYIYKVVLFVDGVLEALFCCRIVLEVAGDARCEYVIRDPEDR